MLELRGGAGVGLGRVNPFFSVDVRSGVGSVKTRERAIRGGPYLVSGGYPNCERVREDRFRWRSGSGRRGGCAWYLVTLTARGGVIIANDERSEE
jgi:hypothetical protein